MPTPTVRDLLLETIVDIGDIHKQTTWTDLGKLTHRALSLMVGVIEAPETDQDKQDRLISGVNIKTFGGYNVLGPGDVPVIFSTNDFTTEEKVKLAGIATSATANNTDAYLLARANHTGFQSADTILDGVLNKVFLEAEKTKLAGIAPGATANDSNENLLARSNHTGAQSADTITDGIMSKVFLTAEKNKLASIAEGATANSSDAFLLARANHTGTQSADTIVNGIANKVFSAAEQIKLAGLSSASNLTFSTDPQAIGATHVNFWGDSLGVSHGGSATKNFPDGYPISEYVKNLTGMDVRTYSVSGQTSTLIKARFLAAPDEFPYGAIFEMGTNNAGSPATVQADIAECVAALGHDRYLVCGVPGHSTPSYWEDGGASYPNNFALNSALAATYGERFVDIRAALVAAYNPAVPQDVIDFSHNLIPSSLMYSTDGGLTYDVVHYNDQGNAVWAEAIAEKDYLLYPGDADSKILTTSNLLALFQNAPSIKTRTVVSERVAINFENVSDLVYPDATNQTDNLAVEINGGVGIWNQQAVAGKEGGILIRNKDKDSAGKATVSIMGTNLAVWTLAKGLVLSNNEARFSFGSPVNIAGDLSVSLTVVSVDGRYSGTVKSLAYFIGDQFSTPRRQIDFSKVVTHGMLPPVMTQAEITAADAAPVADRTLISEVVWNYTTGRLMAAPDPSTTGYGAFKALAYTTDIPSLANYAILSGSNTFRYLQTIQGGPAEYNIATEKMLTFTKLTTSGVYSQIIDFRMGAYSDVHGGGSVPNTVLNIEMSTTNAPAMTRVFSLQNNGVLILDGYAAGTTRMLTVNTLGQLVAATLPSGVGDAVLANSNTFTGAVNTFNNILTIAGTSSTDSKLKVGTLEFQPYGLNNAWFGENAYYGTTGFKTRATGASGLFYFAGAEGQFRFSTSLAAGTTITPTVQMKVNADGTVAIGNNIATAGGDYTGATLIASTAKVTIPGHSTVESKLTVGSLEVQSYALDNVIVSSNLYYNGNWKYRAAAPGSYMQLTGGSIVFMSAASGAAGAAATMLPRLTIAASGAINLPALAGVGNRAIGVNAAGDIVLM